ncbi:unnamed protein product [Xylocopa violacea]|uniref:Uncharacterized protein n=1 Tax=Xylocopa violacea TaxID=135666 RepID=A0ABP1P6W5_XYLVO
MIYTVQRCVTLMCKKNISFDIFGKINTISISCDHVLTKRILMTKFSLWGNHNNTLHTTRVLFEQTKSSSKIAGNKSEKNYAAASQLKKRPKKRKSLSTDEKHYNAWNVKALATSEEYNLEALVEGLLQQQLYLPSTISTTTSCKYIRIII